jgi:hypothetical protein
MISYFKLLDLDAQLFIVFPLFIVKDRTIPVTLIVQLGSFFKTYRNMTEYIAHLLTQTFRVGDFGDVHDNGE